MVLVGALTALTLPLPGVNVIHGRRSIAGASRPQYVRNHPLTNPLTSAILAGNISG